MALLAVIGRYWVTPGACSGVPISGLARPLLTGQATCPASLSWAAAQSEPHRPPAGCQARCTSRPGPRHGARCTRGAGGAGCTPGARTAPGGASAYTGCSVRPG